MSGFSVVLDDVSAMASTFYSEADIYRDLKSKVTPPTADTGDGALNGVLKAVMETLDVLHTNMATTIEDHGDKLKAARDVYAKQEIDNHGLFDDLMKDVG
ncbi:MAG: DUF6317 family protein [Pseudonocardiaceae bacterium]